MNIHGSHFWDYSRSTQEKHLNEAFIRNIYRDRLREGGLFIESTFREHSRGALIERTCEGAPMGNVHEENLHGPLIGSTSVGSTHTALTGSTDWGCSKHFLSCAQSQSSSGDG